MTKRPRVTATIHDGDVQIFSVSTVQMVRIYNLIGKTSSEGNLFSMNSKLKKLIIPPNYISLSRRTLSEKVAKDTSEYKIFIDGFPRLSSRKDLLKLLGDIIPVSIDPILDINLYPCGKYLLACSSPKDIFGVRFKVSNSPLKSLRYSLAPNVIQRARESATSHRITSRIVRLVNIQPEIGEEELRYVLQDFKLDSDAFRTVICSDKQKGSSLFVQFDSEEEAKRAVLMKNLTVLMGKNLQMLHYNI